MILERFGETLQFLEHFFSVHIVFDEVFRTVHHQHRHFRQAEI